MKESILPLLERASQKDSRFPDFEIKEEMECKDEDVSDFQNFERSSSDDFNLTGINKDSIIPLDYHQMTQGSFRNDYRFGNTNLPFRYSSFDAQQQFNHYDDNQRMMFPNPYEQYGPQVISFPNTSALSPSLRAGLRKEDEMNFQFQKRMHPRAEANPLRSLGFDRLNTFTSEQIFCEESRAYVEESRKSNLLSAPFSQKEQNIDQFQSNGSLLNDPLLSVKQYKTPFEFNESEEYDEQIRFGFDTQLPMRRFPSNLNRNKNCLENQIPIQKSITSNEQDNYQPQYSQKMNEKQYWNNKFDSCNNLSEDLTDLTQEFESETKPSSPTRSHFQSTRKSIKIKKQAQNNYIDPFIDVPLNGNSSQIKQKNPLFDLEVSQNNQLEPAKISFNEVADNNLKIDDISHSPLLVPLKEQAHHQIEIEKPKGDFSSNDRLKEKKQSSRQSLHKNVYKNFGKELLRYIRSKKDTQTELTKDEFSELIHQLTGGLNDKDSKQTLPVQKKEKLQQFWTRNLTGQSIKSTEVQQPKKKGQKLAMKRIKPDEPEGTDFQANSIREEEDEYFEMDSTEIKIQKYFRRASWEFFDFWAYQYVMGSRKLDKKEIHLQCIPSFLYGILCPQSLETFKPVREHQRTIHPKSI